MRATLEVPIGPRHDPLRVTTVGAVGCVFPAFKKMRLLDQQQGRDTLELGEGWLVRNIE